MFPTLLRREIILLVAVKAVLLTGLYFAFFSPAHQTHPTPAMLQTHLLGAQSP